MVVGNVRLYRGAHQGGKGSQTGYRKNGQVWHVQHPERPKQGSGIGTLQDGPGRSGLWGFPGEKSYKGVYTQEVSGFQVMATEALSAHHRGVAIFYRKAENFAIKELRLHGPNVISFQLVKGQRRWHVVGCSIPPSNALTIEYVAATIRA